MSVDLPELDAIGYAELVQQALNLLPGYTRSWTDFNDSDPGITILQLLCWVDDTLLYRLNQIPPALQLNWVRLVAGATRDRITSLLATSAADEIQITVGSDRYQLVTDLSYVILLRYLRSLEAQVEPDLQAAKLQVLRALDTPARLVSADDYRHLAAQMDASLFDAAGRSAQLPYLSIARTLADPAPYRERLVFVPAIDLPAPLQILDSSPGSKPPRDLFTNRYLATRDPDRLRLERWQPDAAKRAQLTRMLRELVTRFCAGRKLLGTRLEVMAARYTELDLDTQVVLAAGARQDEVLASLAEVIVAWFDPTQGPDGSGWPLDTPPNPEHLARSLAHQAGVEGVASLVITSATHTGIRLPVSIGPDCRLGQPDPPLRGLPWLRSLSLRAIPTMPPTSELRWNQRPT